MMDQVRASADADVVLFLVDATARFNDEDAQAVDLVKKTGAPAIAVFNKIDKLREKAKLLALIERYQGMHDFAAYIPISALKGDGVELLRKEILSAHAGGSGAVSQGSLDRSAGAFSGGGNHSREGSPPDAPGSARTPWR